MFCGKCGANNLDGATFCKECGAKLSGTSTEKQNNKKRKSRILLPVAIVLVILLVAGGTLYFSFNKRTDEADVEKLGEIATEEVAEETGATEPAASSVESVAEEPTPERSVYSEGIHEYSILMADCTWDEAKNMCQENGGHLVTFETDEEYQHVLSLIDSNRDCYYYIGGTCFEDKYYWIASEGVNNSSSLESRNNWMQGEPSYTDGNRVEDKMGIFYYKKENRWVWNDVPNALLEVVDSYKGSLGYICEYE